MISNENGWRHHSPSITTRFTSGWRPCWKKRRLLKSSNNEDDEPAEETLTDLLFFDFERQQENVTHEPNLCIAHNEAGDEWIFEGDTTQKEFANGYSPMNILVAPWWLTISKAMIVTLFYSIYASKASGTKWLRGGKTLSLKILMFNIRFVDSLNFR